MNDARRRELRLERGTQQVRTAFPAHHVSVALTQDSNGREHWQVAIEMSRHAWESCSGDDLDAVIARIKDTLGRRTS